MSKIAVRVEGYEEHNRTEVVACLRGATGVKLNDIVRRLRSGEPIVEYALYGNTHDKVAGRLRQLLDCIPATGARLRIYQLPSDKTYATYPNVSLQEITPEILNNILCRYDQLLEESEVDSP